jgi:transposase
MVGRPRVVMTAAELAELEALARSPRRNEADRARAVVLSVQGWTSGQIARAFGVTPDSVRRWRTWFMAEGVNGLRAIVQPGAAPVKSDAALALAAQVLPAPVPDQPNWTLPRLQAEMATTSCQTISKAQLSKALKKGGADGAARGTVCAADRMHRPSTAAA